MLQPLCKSRGFSRLLRLTTTLILLLTIGIGNVWADYTLIKSNTSLSNGDKVVLVMSSSTPTNGTSTGVTGQSGSDATVSTTEANWVQYTVGSASASGWTLYDGTASKYIASPSKNQFVYGASGGTCSVNSNGVLVCNSRYLCANGTYYRMYTSIGSYTPFYVWKVSAGTTPTLTTSSSMTTLTYSAGSPVAQSFTIGGSNLTNTVTVTAPTDYEVCKTSGGTYTSSVSFTNAEVNAANKTVYIRLQSGLSAGNIASRNITVASSGATSKTIAITGSVPYTITWMANGSTFTTTYVAVGSTLTLPISDPNPGTYSCDGKYFYGWYGDGSSYEHASNAPSIASAGAAVVADKTYYAVFADRSGSGAVTWDKVTSAPSDWSGDYVITNSDGEYAMISDFRTGTSGEFLSSAVTLNAAGTQITSTPTNKMIWTVAKNGNNAQYSFKNKSTGTYAEITGTSSTNAALNASVVWFTIESTGTSGVWDVASVTNSARCFSWYASNSSFRTYAKSTNNTGRLYKKSGDGYTWSNYVTTCAASHTVSSEVNPTGKATVTLGATSVAEGSTTTATYSGITTGYEFVNWTISGTGATLSNTTANPTTITMGTADVTVTANLQCITPSISIQPAASTTCLVGATPSLSVTAAAGGASLSYQWKQCATIDGSYTNVASGGTSSTYSPSTASAGTTYYKCVVTNAASGCSNNETSDAAQVTVNAPSGWKFKYSGDSWEEHTMNESAGVASCSISLAADSRFEFGIDDNGAAFYKNNGTIITTTSGWVFNTSDGNCHIHTGPAGTYTFAINTTTKAVTVTYPTVSHPNEHYVYFKNSDVWGTVYGYLANSGNDNKAATWPGSVMSATTTICGETYHYAALNAMSGTYNTIIFNNGNSGYGNQTSDLSTTGSLGKYNANRDAAWHQFKYTISYAAGTGGSGSMSSHTDLCPGSNQALSANTFTKDHYHFTGWVADVDVTINSATVTAGTLITGTPTIQNVQNDITLTAQWEINSNTLTWNWGGGSTSSTTYTLYPATSGAVNYGAAITKPADNSMSKTGYTFSSWSSNATTMPDEALTITANWTAKTTSITLNKNNSDASGSTAGSASYVYDQTANSSFTAATRTGYNVSGYYTATSDGTKILNADGSLAGNNITVDAVVYTNSGKWAYDGTSLTLYAQWTAKTTTVSFNQNGGTGGQTTTKTATYSQAMPTPITVPTKAGYTFTGYYENSGGTGTKYYNADGSSATNWNKENATWTLYAGWTAKTDTYKTALHTSAAGWTSYASGYTTGTSGAGYTIPNPGSVAKGVGAGCEDTHYHFAGWVTDANKEAGTISGNIIPATGTTDATGTTYWAVWEKEAAGGGTSTGGITQAEVTAAAANKSAGSYADQTSASASGNWTGNYAYNTQNNKKVLQMRNTNNSSIISPVFAGNITAISVVYTVSAQSNRTLTFKDGGTTLGTLTAIASTTETASSELSVSGSHTSFVITASTGAVFFHSITVTYSTVSYEDPKAVCEDCVETPSITSVSLMGNAFSTTSVPVQATGASAGTNCSLTSYGFYWGTSANPSGNNTASNNLSTGTFSATLTGPFTIGTTYYYRAYATNEGDNTDYSSDGTFILQNVSFNMHGHGGGAPATQVVPQGGKATNPGNPSEAGCTFGGWYDNDSYTGSAWDFSTNTVGSGGVTLHAKWTETSYVLTQTTGSHTTKGHAGTSIKTSDIASSDLELTYSISDGAYALPKTVTVSGGGIATWVLGTNYTWTLSADKHTATLAILQGQTISANVTVTVTEQARYTVTLDEHGSTTTQYYAADDNLFTWGDIANCGEKLFYGWTTDAVFTENNTTPPTCVLTKGTETINSTRTYYAIYADAVVPQNPGYEKITSGVTAGTYLIATSRGSNEFAYKAVTSHVSATISNGVISSLPTNATEVLVELGTGDDAGYFAISYDNSGTKTYIYAPSSNGLSTTTTATYDWHLDTDNSTIGQIHSKGQTTRYIQSNNGGSGNGDFKAYGHTQEPTYLYKKQTTTYSNFTKSCSLHDITITTPSGGTVTTTPAAGTDAAGEGQSVTVTATPNSCKYLSALSYNDGNDDFDILSTRSFTMPAADVTVTATFSNKSVSSIAPITNTHRTLMQNTSFLGEEIRVTYNNGETEDLAWNDATLTFSSYNMSTLGNQTVNVAYSGSCGNANTSYSIEITDGIYVTYHDGNNSFVRKYELAEIVGVDTITGKVGCAGYTFVGWSEAEISSTDDEYVPVHNFAASTARTLYAVYALRKQTGWMSIEDATGVRSGAEYMYVKVRYSDAFALSNTASGANANYMAANMVTDDMATWRRTADNKDFQTYSGSAPVSSVWQVIKPSTNYYFYNAAVAKYLKVTSSAVQLTTSPEDNIIFETGSNDCEVNIKSSSSNYYASGYYSNPNYYFNPYGEQTTGHYLLTRDSLFTTNPPCTPRSVTFYGNGGTVTDGENEDGTLVVTEATRDAGITTPTAAMDGADCNGNTWEFLGWLNRELAKTRIPVLTTDLLNDGGGNKPHTIQADDEEYYAVYYNTDKPETKYGTITLNKNDIGQNYVNSEQTTTKTVASMGDYTFGYVDLGHQSSIGMQFESGLGELYNKTSLGKINSISFTNFTSGGISNLRVYVGDEEHTTDHLLGNAEMHHIDGSNTWTYYPSDNYPYVYIKDNSGYVNVQSISIEFGKGATVYATTPDCSLRVTYKAAGEDDYVVEIGESDPHNLPAYYPAGCGNKEFIGWAEEGIPALQQTAPTIATADGSLTNVHSIKTLYAVYASRNGGKVTGTHTLTEDFESYTANSSYGNTGLTFNNTNGLAWVIDYGNVTSTTASTFGVSNGKHVILYPNAAQGSGINNVLKMSSGVNDVIGVSLYAFKNAGSITGKLYWSGNGTSWTEENSVSLLLLTNNNPYQTSKTFNTIQQALWIKIIASEPSLNNGHYLYLNDIVFTIADHAYYYTDYSTTCETASAPVALTWAGTEGSTIEAGTEPATSALGNLLVLPTLSKDNYRFDGWKATINGDQKADVYLGGETFLINHPVTFTAQWTELFVVSGPTAGVTSYKDISITSSETFTVTTKGTHSITPVVYGLSDDTHFAVTITTPGTNDGDDTDFSCTFTYTPDAFGTGSGAATHTATFRFQDEVSGAVSEQVTIRGRSLPEEFVIAVKNNNKWYALPSNLQNTSSQPAIVPVEITVNDPTTPTAALLAPQTALYKATTPYQNAHTTALRFTATGSNYLQVSTVEGTYNMWLSTTGGTNVQDWQLYSTNFNAYELTIPSNAYPTKKMGIYDGSYMGYHTSPSNSQIYLLPVTADYTPRDAKVKEWGRYSVVVEVETTNIATVKAHIDNAAPTAALTPQPVNVATIAGAKNLLINTVDAIDFSAQEGHSLYLDWYNASNELIASSQISVPLIIAGNTTMSSIDAVKTHWEKKEVHVLPGVKLTADADAYASENVTIKTLEVYPNATLHISAGTLNATNLHLRGGWTRANGKDYDVARVYIDPSAALTKTHAAMYYDIFDSDEGKHYYPLAVPFDVPVSTIDYADEYLAGFSTYGTHYIIKTYDGALRAEYGVIDDAWAAVASDGTLQAGRGYIITAVAVKGDAVIRIPLSFDNAWTAAGEKATVSAVTKNIVPVVAHTGTASTGESANNKRHAGWNMLGVPFMSCYTAGTDMYATDALIKGEIVIVGGSEGFAYQNTTVPYVSVPTHNFSEYIQTDITEAKLVPGWSFFVQVGTSGNLTFLANKQREDSDTPLYAPQRNDKDQTGNRAALVLAGKGSTDKTTLIISDRYNASYEIGADLEKMFGNGNTLATYTIMEDGTRLVFNALGNKEIANSVPVGFRVPAAGEYTFSLDDSYPTEQFERIDLIDYQQGTLTNLLENSYTFTTEGTQNDSRFALNAELRRLPLIPTATDNVSDNGNQVEKRIVDGYLIIIRNGRIYDATGKLKVTTAE